MPPSGGSCRYIGQVCPPVPQSAALVGGTAGSAGGGPGLVTSPASSTTAPSLYLLLTYAVECGLKAVILRDEGLHSGADLIHDPILQWIVRGGTGHEISRLAYKAGYTPYTVNPLSCTPLVVPSGSRWLRQARSGELHLVWRYEVGTNSSSETTVVGQLESMARWIEGELP